MRQTVSWFRSWHGAPTDAKWLTIAKRAGTTPGVVSATVWALLDHASQNGNRGSIDGFDIESYAAFSGFEESIIEAIIHALTQKGIIDEGRWAAWDKRQPKREDDSIDRVRRYRERQRGQDGNDSADDVTQSNAMSRSVTPDQIRSDQNRTEQSRTDVTQSNAMSHTPPIHAAVYESFTSHGWPLTDDGKERLSVLIATYGAGPVTKTIDKMASRKKPVEYPMAYLESVFAGKSPAASSEPIKLAGWDL